MAIFSYGAAGSIGFSSKTLGDMKKIVARVLGAQGDPDSVGAGDAINSALDRLNEHEWDYLTVKGDDITVTGGTDTYELPTPIKAPVSLRLGGRGLEYIRRAQWDKANVQTIGGVPTHYTLFNSRLSGNVQLIPGPGSGGTMEIRYYRPVKRPTSNGEALDILEWMERYVMFEGMAQLALQHGDELGKYDRLQAIATEALKGALASDRLPGGPDADINFQPYDAWGSRTYNVDHPYYYLYGEED
jgi:hypothetical protein